MFPVKKKTSKLLKLGSSLTPPLPHHAHQEARLPLPDPPAEWEGYQSCEYHTLRRRKKRQIKDFNSEIMMWLMMFAVSFGEFFRRQAAKIIYCWIIWMVTVTFQKHNPWWCSQMWCCLNKTSLSWKWLHTPISPPLFRWHYPGTHPRLERSGIIPLFR